MRLSEFEELLPSFEQAWQDYIYRHYITRDGRQRGYGGGRKAELKDTRDKLLFILFYMVMETACGLHNFRVSQRLVAVA